MASVEWLIARRYLAARRKGRFLSFISLFAVGGVTLGVTALIVVIAVMTGLQSEMQSLILGSTPHVYVFDAGAGNFQLANWQFVLSEVGELEDITTAEPFVMTQVLAGTNVDNSSPGVLFGIDPHVATEPMNDVERQIRQGTLAMPSGQLGQLPGLLMGSSLATRIGAFQGDTVTLVGAHFDETPAGPYPRLREFIVTGVFTTGMFEYDDQYLYTDLDAASELLALGPDTVSGIGANTRDPWNAREVAGRLQEALGHRYFVSDWTTSNGALFSALKLEKFALYIILFLIILVAAFNIVSMLVMVVAEKTREIGILKSMGLTDRSVQRLFMLQGLVIGLIGTSIGALGGLTLVYLLDRYQFISLPPDVYFIDHLPVALHAMDVVLILGFSMLIAFVSTIHPAHQASRLAPVDAIRHE